MKLIRPILLALAGLCACLCMLSSIAYTQITNSAQMLNGFYQFADTSLKDVPASAYMDYARAITGYLDGSKADLTVTAADGTERPGFSEKELAHMEDVRGIVRGVNVLRYVTGGIALLTVAVFWAQAQKRENREAVMRDLLRGTSAGCYILLGILLALGIWGAVNFTGLFVTFHKVMFRNSLWLLNPRQDLLIMLMPTPFFTWYAQQIALACWPVLALMAALIAAGIRFGRSRSAGGQKQGRA